MGRCDKVLGMRGVVFPPNPTPSQLDTQWLPFYGWSLQTTALVSAVFRVV